MIFSRNRNQLFLDILLFPYITGQWIFSHKHHFDNISQITIGKSRNLKIDYDIQTRFQNPKLLVIGGLDGGGDDAR